MVGGAKLGTRPLPRTPVPGRWSRVRLSPKLNNRTLAAAHCRLRVEMSQDPKTAMPAATAAGEIAAVVNASLLPPAAPASAGGYAYTTLAGLGGWAASALGRGSSSGGAPASDATSAGGSEQGEGAGAEPPVWRARPPPGWFLAGGNARQFWLVGVAQKLLPRGWPSNGLLAKKFGLDRPLG